MTARLPYGSQRPPQPGLYADLFARCAVVSSRAGDAALASWRWHAAHAFDPKIASESVSALGASTELPAVRGAGQGLPPLSVAESKDWHEYDRWILGSKPPQFVTEHDRAAGSLRGGFKCDFGLEAILGRDGRLREPVVVRFNHCVPTQVMVILNELGPRQYEPATQGGEPVDVGYRLQLADLTQSTSRGPGRD